MKIKFLGLIFSFALATASLFSLSGCALKSSCDMKSGQSCHMDGKGKSCNCDKEGKKCSCDMKDGKCSCDMKSDKKGSCGTGKCGSESSMDKPKTK